MRFMYSFIASILCVKDSQEKKVSFLFYKLQFFY